MDATVVTEQTLCVEVNEHDYRLEIPRNAPLQDGYQALIIMANIFHENMIKEQQDMRDQLPKVETEEVEAEVVEVE